jgi:ABC-2 type transport system ATP-binding protein
VSIAGFDATSGSLELRRSIGLVPSGDRSFYLRISGLENLAFFARLFGMRRRQAVGAAHAALDAVGLGDAAKLRVAAYSHGMQKRLSVARALLTEPRVLLVDEATHDLDPDGARIVRELVAGVARRGAAVVWATQRLDEIRGFADRVTVLDEGTCRFNGTVPDLMAQVTPSRYLLRLQNGSADAASLERIVRAALSKQASVTTAGGRTDEFLVSLADGVVLGDALSSLIDARLLVLACREERSEIEEAFLHLTGGHAS